MTGQVYNNFPHCSQIIPDNATISPHDTVHPPTQHNGQTQNGPVSRRERQPLPWLLCLQHKFQRGLIPPSPQRGSWREIYMRMNYLIFWTILNGLLTGNWHLDDFLLRRQPGAWLVVAGAAAWAVVKKRVWPPAIAPHLNGCPNTTKSSFKILFCPHYFFTSQS